MYNNRLSEKIAQVFVIVDILLLILGSLSMIPPVIFIFLGLFSMQFAVFSIGLIPILIFGIGVTLFVGYLKHSGGNLNENKILLLWFGTLVYNGLPLLITLLSLIVREDYRNLFIEKIGIEDFGVFSALTLCWWIIATCLSLTAIYNEFENSKT
jgi:hypothetical protein